MVGVGPSYSSDYQVDPRNRTYPLPTIKEGVGIYWAENSGLSSPDWDAKSYRTTVVRDPAGTILLVAAPNGQDAAGNIWPCICVGPVWSPSGSAPSAFYQLDPTRPIQNPGSGSAVSQGWITYQAHGNRFNYLFHDNHVEALTIEQTIGTGTTNAPKGMWTVAVGD
jgi:prepilin-type processing-associated H-X9-DG protein